MSSSALENQVRESPLNLNHEKSLKDLFWRTSLKHYFLFPTYEPITM
jgi:hypothetical protein